MSAARRVLLRPSLAAVLPLAGLAVLFWLGACRRAPAPRTPQPVPVETALAVAADVPVTLAAVGVVEPLRTVEVKARVEGVVAALCFREGAEVAAGDLLATLDRRPFEIARDRARAQFAAARAEAAQAAADADRYRRLDAQQAVSKERLGQLLTQVEATAATVLAREADVGDAELRLGYTEIRAPISGRTGRLQLHEGALVRANDSTLVVVNQLDPVAVTFSVPENTLAAVRAALAAGPVVVRANPAVAPGAGESPAETNALAPVAAPALRPDAAGPVAVEGELAFVDNTVNAATGTIVLKAVFPNSGRVLWPGQFVDVATRLGLDRGAVTVPAAAVQNGQRGPQIFVVQADRTVALRPVRAGRGGGGRIVILEGVAAGETVVVNGQLRLVPGAKVEPRTVEQAVAGGKASVAKTGSTPPAAAAKSTPQS